MPGLFVTIEGIDRSGKSTQAVRLTEALGDVAILVREPGGTPAGERIRGMLKDHDVKLSARAEALLFAAARAQLVEQVIRPALAAGRVVVSDRFLDSSLAYQGHARGLGADEVRRVNEWAIAGLQPDVTILLRIDPEEAARREAALDRFEEEGIELQRRVAAGYDALVEAEPERWRVVDALRPADEVAAEIAELVEGVRTTA